MQQVAMEMNLADCLSASGPEGYHWRWVYSDVEVDLCGHAHAGKRTYLWREVFSPAVAWGWISYPGAGLLTAARGPEESILDFPGRHE